MARANRSPGQPLVVPEPPPAIFDPENNGHGGEVDDETDLEDEFGELTALTDESYREAQWIVWRRRPPGSSAPRGQVAATYLAKFIGPLDLEAIREKVGGGSFRICGYLKGRKFVERPVDFEGPLKVYPNEPQPVSAPVVQSPAGADQLAAVLTRVMDRLEHVERIVTHPPAPPAAPMTMADVIAAAKMLRPEPAAAPAEAAIGNMVQLLQQGIELGAQREPREGTDWAAIIEKALPLLEKTVTAALSRRPGQPVRRATPAATPPASGSHAEVVATEPAAPTPEGESPRMTVVIEALARAIAAMGTETEIDPAGFAETVETVLEPAEAAMLRLGTVDQLMAELEAVADRFPVFRAPQARVFVDAVLKELREPTTE
jgi:hypothetical protein